MKTLKKILVMCMTLVVMVGVTGCVGSIRGFCKICG